MFGPSQTSPGKLSLAVGLGAVSGFLTGTVGIGGIIILPILIHGFEFTPHDAIRACMLAYIITAAGGTGAYARHQSINWRECVHVLYAATPASFAAAASLNLFSGDLLRLILYVIMGTTSLLSLGSLVGAYRKEAEKEQRLSAVPAAAEAAAAAIEDRTSLELDLFGFFRSGGGGLGALGAGGGPNVSPLDSPPALAEADMAASESMIGGGGGGEEEEDVGGIDKVTKYQMWILGGLAGLLSPLTGTNGPVVFLPLALTFNYPILNALGAAQIIQFPISIASTITFALTDDINVPLALALAAGATPAAVLGGTVAHRVNKLNLQIVVTGLLVGASLILLLAFFLVEEE